MNKKKQLVRRAFISYDQVFRKLNGLIDVGPILYLGPKKYQGKLRRFADQTVLYPGQSMGFLHMDNSRIAELYESDPAGKRVPFRFVKLLLESFKNLALAVSSDPARTSFSVYSGINWFNPHGKSFGFLSEELPDGLYSAYLRRHFHLLLYAYVPEYEFKVSGRLKPRIFWLTRKQLLEQFKTVKDRRKHKDGIAES